MKLINLFFLFVLFLFCNISLYATFSIAAIDLNTGEVGVAGATCLDNGASIIGGVVPGIGAVNSQSLVCTPENENLLYALKLMEMGASAQEILDSLYTYDKCGTETNEYRQYGLALFAGNGTPESASFTGSDADSYAGGVTGINYAVQGNILLNSSIITGIESGFLNTNGSFADKLMAALQGANVAGADSRCLADGTSSSGAFMKIACHPDSSNCNNIFLDVFYLNNGVEPIDTLQSLYNSYISNLPQAENTNDECVDAIAITIDFNSTNVLPEFIYSTKGSTETTYPLRDCDKNLVKSDVWFKFTSPSVLPVNDFLFEAGANNGNKVGFALYDACNATANMILCGPAGNSVLTGDTSIIRKPLSPECLDPDKEYYLKVWLNTETWYDDAEVSVAIMSYDSLQSANSNIIWSDDFENGLNNWVTSSSPDPFKTWIWDADGLLAGIATADILSKSKCNGAAIFHSDKYLTDGLFDNIPNQPYPIQGSELISGSIDLSGVDFPAIRFMQHFRGLTGNQNQTSIYPPTSRGAMLRVSIDGGNTWIQTINVNDNLSPNASSARNDEVMLEFPILADQSDVKINFTYDGDFYFWAIDDIEVFDNKIYGCTELCFEEYDPDANTDDGSCINSISACGNLFAVNYDPDVSQQCSDISLCIFNDTDGDGIDDNFEDINNNGVFSDDDTDNDGISNFFDPDDDGDGIPTIDEDYNQNGDPFDDDLNQNGIPDFLDPDVTSTIIEFNNAVNIHPNPTNGKFKIGGENTIIEQIKVYNSKGALINYIKQVNGEFDISNSEKGIYFIEISLHARVLYKKLILN